MSWPLSDGRGQLLSGIILAGGSSRRMGRDKAALTLGSRTLLQLQADKLRALGIEDIMASGAETSIPPGIRSVPDERPSSGPLGGLHACLRAARRDTCLVVSVDTPLVPAETLALLCRSHRGGITVLRRAGRVEPLIGVYDRAAGEQIAALLDRGKRAVQALKERVPWREIDYDGPRELLINCNTPEEFAAAELIWKRENHRC